MAARQTCTDDSEAIGLTDAVKRHNKETLKQLEAGDLIEFPRVLYSHWAVYIYNGIVIHYSKNKKEGHFEVREDTFVNAAKGGKAYKNNTKDGDWTPLEKEDIVKRANNMKGRTQYNALWENCEHFANDCRYGRKESYQADFAKGAAASIAIVGVSGITLYYVYKRSNRKNEEKSLLSNVLEFRLPQHQDRTPSAPPISTVFPEYQNSFFPDNSQRNLNNTDFLSSSSVLPGLTPSAPPFPTVFPESQTRFFKGN